MAGHYNDLGVIDAALGDSCYRLDIIDWRVNQAPPRR